MVLRSGPNCWAWSRYALKDVWEEALVNDGGSECVGDAGWGWGEWSMDAAKKSSQPLPRHRRETVRGHTGNRALADKPDGGGALSVLSSLAKSLGGEHGGGSGCFGCFGCEIEVGLVVRWLLRWRMTLLKLLFLLATMAVLAKFWSAVSRADSWWQERRRGQVEGGELGVWRAGCWSQKGTPARGMPSWGFSQARISTALGNHACAPPVRVSQSKRAIPPRVEDLGRSSEFTIHTKTQLAWAGTAGPNHAICPVPSHAGVEPTFLPVLGTPLLQPVSSRCHRHQNQQQLSGVATRERASTTTRDTRQQTHPDCLELITKYP